MSACPGTAAVNQDIVTGRRFFYIMIMRSNHRSLSAGEVGPLR